MRDRSTLLVLLVVAVLAGCASEEDAPSVAEGDVSAAAVAPEAAGDAPEAAPAPRVVPLAWEATLGRGANVCVIQPSEGRCFGVDDAQWGAELGHEGTASALRLVLTWTPSTPATQQLLLEVALNAETVLTTAGASPLELTVDEPAQLAGAWAQVGPIRPGVGMSDVDMWATANGVDQPFALEGELVFDGATSTPPPNP